MADKKNKSSTGWGGMRKNSGAGRRFGRLQKAVLLAGTVLAVAGGTAAQAEQAVGRIFVVGDSLSDGGTYTQAAIAGSGGALPSTTNYRFTANAADGSALTYAEYLAKSFGFTISNNVYSAVPAAGLPQQNLGGTNYAEGGSRVAELGATYNPTNGITTTPILTQIDRMLASTSSFADNDLVMLWGGANDLLTQATLVSGGTITPDAAAANMATAATQLKAGIDRLTAAGAKNIIVLTIPDVTATPYGASLGGANSSAGLLLRSLQSAFNTTLSSGLSSSRAIVFDSSRLLGAIIANPTAYGFNAPNAATAKACTGSSLTCLQGVNTVGDASQYIFADDIHPTATAHQILSQALMGTITAAYQNAAVALSTQATIRQHRSFMENRLNSTAFFEQNSEGALERRQEGSYRVYGTTRLSYQNYSSDNLAPDVTGPSEEVQAGVDVMLTNSTLVGVSVGFGGSQKEFDSGHGEFDSWTFSGTVYGVQSLTDTIYLSLAGGANLTDYREITREFNLGPRAEKFTGSTEGYGYFFRAGIGANVPVTTEISVLPSLAFTTEQLTVEGYAEKTGAASLAFGDTDYTSNRISAGFGVAFAPKSLPDWSFLASATLEHDFNTDDLEIGLGSSANSLGIWEVERPIQTWGTLGLSASRATGKGILSLAANTTINSNGFEGIAAEASFKLPF